MTTMHSNRPGRRAAARPFHWGALVVLAGLLASSCATWPWGRETPLTEEERALNVASFEVAWETIRDAHWDPTLGGQDWDAVHEALYPRVEAARTQAAYRNVMRDLIEPFEQSHFSVVPCEVHEQLQAPAGEGPQDGVTGIDVRVVDGAVLVTKVDAGSPAAELGVRPGWEILKIDGRKVASMLRDVAETFEGKTMLGLIQHHMAARMLAGKVGEEKRIRFDTGSGDKVALSVGLAAEKGTKYQLGDLPPMYAWFESARPEDDVGYLAFNLFMDPVNLMPAFEEAVQSFQDCRGIVIDVRGNGGGLPIMAMGMAGWLIDRPNEYFGTMRTRDTELKFVVNPRRPSFDGPVAILIDGSSASCAEIFAGGLRDMGRTRLFGARTAGAVLPAHWRELPNGDFFFYPIADYFSNNGDRLEAVGVAPDVEMPRDRAALLEGRDTALDAAIRWIRDDAAG